MWEADAARAWSVLIFALARFWVALGTYEREEVKKKGASQPTGGSYTVTSVFMEHQNSRWSTHGRGPGVLLGQTISHVARVFNAKDPSTFEEGSLGATDVVTTNHIILRSKNAQAHGAVPLVDSSTNGYRTDRSCDLRVWVFEGVEL